MMIKGLTFSPIFVPEAAETGYACPSENNVILVAIFLQIFHLKKLNCLTWLQTLLFLFLMLCLQVRSSTCCIVYK